MTIKQQGGIFGRNPTFNDVGAENLTASTSISSPLIDTLRLTDDGSSGLRLYSKQSGGRGLIFASGIIYPSGNSGATNNNGTDLGTASVRFKDIYTNNVKLASGGGIDFGSNTLVDVNNGVPVAKTVGSSVTDVAHITTTSGGYTNFIFEVYAFSSGNNMPAKGTILARGYSGAWATVELKDEQLSGTTPINLSVGNSGADLIVKATQPNSSTLTMFIKSIYKTNVSITVA